MTRLVGGSSQGSPADDGVELLATLKDHHGRDGADAVLGGHARGLIGVQLHLEHTKKSGGGTHKENRRQGRGVRCLILSC